MPVTEAVKEYRRTWIRSRRADPEFARQEAAAKARAIAERREFIRNAKRKPCADCGIEYPTPVMEFDHVRGVKRHNLSRMAKGRYSLRAIQAEIDKCDVVCANCHRLRHTEIEDG